MTSTIDTAGGPARGSMLVDVFQHQRSAPRTGRAPIVDTPRAGPADGADYAPRPAVAPAQTYDATGRRVPAVTPPAVAPASESELADPMAPHTMWERLRIQGEQLLGFSR